MRWSVQKELSNKLDKTIDREEREQIKRGYTKASYVQQIRRAKHLRRYKDG